MDGFPALLLCIFLLGATPIAALLAYALRTWQEMTYLRPYVNNMLRNHPHGEKFKEIRDLADRVGTCLPEEITNPESKLSYESRQKELFKGWALASLLIEGVFLLTFSGNTRSYYGERHRNDPKYFDPLKQKLSDLMDVLDQSKIQNSFLHIWCKKEHQAAPMSSASLKVFETYT